jgi:hypothetical protein
MWGMRPSAGCDVVLPMRQRMRWLFRARRPERAVPTLEELIEAFGNPRGARRLERRTARYAAR